jgi:hypothetical protein
MKTLYIIISITSLEAAKERLSDIAGSFINVNTFAHDTLIEDLEAAKDNMSYFLRGLIFEFKTF